MYSGHWQIEWYLFVHPAVFPHRPERLHRALIDYLSTCIFYTYFFVSIAVPVAGSSHTKMRGSLMCMHGGNKVANMCWFRHLLLSPSTTLPSAPKFYISTHPAPPSRSSCVCRPAVHLRASALPSRMMYVFKMEIYIELHPMFTIMFIALFMVYTLNARRRLGG